MPETTSRTALRKGSGGYYRDMYAAAAPSRAGEPAWLTRLRAEAMDRFDALGFPLPSDEEWRFTPIGPIAETLFEAAPSEPVPAHDHPVLQSYAERPAARLVIVNGRYAPSLSSPPDPEAGVRIASLSTGSETDLELVERYLGGLATGGPSLTSLNTALLSDCTVVRLHAGARISTPIEIVYVSAGSAEPHVAFPRLLVVADAGSEATIIETFAAADAVSYWTNAVAELAVGDNAAIHHYRLQHESPSAYHTGRTAVRLGRGSRYVSHVVHTGSAIARHDLGAVLSGEGGSCTFNGLYLGRERQIVDNHTVIDHAVPHCESHELYKGILNDRAHGVFNGKVFVRQDAQKTDAKQSNHTLLLSEAAHVDTKPQLEIFADDVRCTHGATIGRLDADALFYLRSRGIALEDARSVLVHAFASEVIDMMAVPAVRSRVEEIMLAALPKPSSVFGE